MTADEIDISAKSEKTEKVFGVQGGSDPDINELSKIELNASTIKVYAEAKNATEDVIGVYSNHTEMNFNGLAEITVKGGTSRNSFGVAADSDEDNQDTTIVNFNENVKVTVSSETSATGVRASGLPSNINFGKDAKIEATSTANSAVGIQVQYSGSVKGKGNVDITVKAAETSNGILNTSYADGSLGHLIIDGATTITAEGNDAFGIRNLVTNGFDPKNDPRVQLNGATTISATATGEDGTAVGIDANHKAPILVTDSTITATSAKGEAFGVRADTDGELTLNGQSTVVAKGDQSVGMSVKTGANVKVIGEATVTGKNAFVGDATSVVNVEGANDRAGGLVLNGNVDPENRLIDTLSIPLNI